MSCHPLKCFSTHTTSPLSHEAGYIFSLGRVEQATNSQGGGLAEEASSDERSSCQEHGTGDPVTNVTNKVRNSLLDAI